MKTHRETYPQQYEHDYCGKLVEFAGEQFTISRVVPSAFGELAVDPRDENKAISLASLTIVESLTKAKP